MAILKGTLIRDHMIVAKFLAGNSCTQIGEWAGVTRARIHQILKKQGVDAKTREEVRKRCYELTKCKFFKK